MTDDEKPDALGLPDADLVSGKVAHWHDSLAQLHEEREVAKEIPVGGMDTMGIPGGAAAGNAYSGDITQFRHDLNKEVDKPASYWDIMDYIGGGTGSSISVDGDVNTDAEIIRRIRYQDTGVMLLLLGIYFTTLLFSASMAYRSASNDAPVDHYADPRYHTQTVQGEDVGEFLEAFNVPPKEVRLQVTGFRPMPLLGEEFMASTQSYGIRQHIAFSFALDLAPWVVRDGQDQDSAASGVPADEVSKLREYLANDTNDLAYVQLQKTVSWKGWEELATNIKTHLRQSGFRGHVIVRPIQEEVMDVHKNKRWANFIHSRTLKAVVVCSLIGWPFYRMYMLWRHQALVLNSSFCVDQKIDQYWRLIADKIGPDGFNSGHSTMSSSFRNSRAESVRHQREQIERQQTLDHVGQEQETDLQSMRY